MTVTTDHAPTPTATKRRWLRRSLRVALTGVAGAGVAVALDGRVPDAHAVLAIAGGADLRWAAVAVLAQLASQAMFAYQQRRLLSAFSVDISPPRALAVTYSRSAISMALPAGSAVSAAYAFQQYRERGASRSIAVTVSILSGVASTAGLVLLYATGLLTAALARPSSHTVVLAGPTALVAAGALAVWSVRRRSRTGRTALPRPEHHTEPRWPAVNRVVQQIASTARQARTVSGRHWAGTIAFATANWLFDLACLIAAVNACHLTVGYGRIAGVYLAAQLVRQLPITPGGIGLIETSLLTGLVAAGAAQTNAAAAVLGYRLVSFWLILPVGLATYLGLRRHNSGPPANPDLPTAGTAGSLPDVGRPTRHGTRTRPPTRRRHRPAGGRLPPASASRRRRTRRAERVPATDNTP